MAIASIAIRYPAPTPISAVSVCEIRASYTGDEVVTCGTCTRIRKAIKSGARNM